MRNFAIKVVFWQIYDIIKVTIFALDEGSSTMAISYKKLWKILIDRDLKKKDLKEMANINGYTIRKLTNNENVSTEVLLKISTALGCSVEDIVEAID